MRSLYLILLFIIHLNAEDAMLLNAHMRLIPKIMYLSNAADSSLMLGVVYSEGRKTTAEKIVSGIQQNYKGLIAEKSFKIMAIPFNELKKYPMLSFLYVTKMDSNTVINVADWALSNSIPTFSYDYKNLDHGILGTITIERNAVIYINKEVLKSGKFQINKSLLEMAKLI